MTYRTDKFAPGDKVAWADDHYATLTGGRAEHGDGPFIIDKVFDREYIAPESYYADEKSNWSSMGHTQHICVIGAGDDTWSGAFFKKVD